MKYKITSKITYTETWTCMIEASSGNEAIDIFKEGKTEVDDYEMLDSSENEEIVEVREET